MEEHVEQECRPQQAVFLPSSGLVHSQVYFRSFRTGENKELQRALPVQDVWLPVSSGETPPAMPPAPPQDDRTPARFPPDRLDKLPDVSHQTSPSSSSAPAQQYVSTANLNLLNAPDVLIHHTISESYAYSVLSFVYAKRGESIAPPPIDGGHPLLLPSPEHVRWPMGTQDAAPQGPDGVPVMRYDMFSVRRKIEE